jgi:hypothetical protein
MLTDEQLIAEVRRELDRELADIAPPAGLVQAVWDQSRPVAARRRWRWPLTAGSGVVAVSAVIAALVAVGAVVLLSGHRAAVAPAQRLAIPRDAASKRTMLAILGVLRRPQTSADRAPGPLKQLNQGLPVGSPIKALERLATVTRSGARIYLVPINKPTQAQINHSLSHLSPKRARPAERRRFEALVRHEPEFRGLDLFGIGGSSGCPSAVAIVTGQCWMSSGGSAGNSVTVVVPDGVAQVSITIRPRNSARLETLAASVHGNVATFQTTALVENLGQDKMVWHARSGAVIARPRPLRASQDARTSGKRTQP